MLNNHVQIKVGGINPQLADLIIRMFLFIFYNRFTVVLIFLPPNRKLCCLPRKVKSIVIPFPYIVVLILINLFRCVGEIFVLQIVTNFKLLDMRKRAQGFKMYS